MRITVNHIASALVKSLDDATIAEIVSALLGCYDDNENLNEYEATAGEALFNALCDLSPRAVAIAQGRDPATSIAAE